MVMCHWVLRQLIPTMGKRLAYRSFIILARRPAHGNRDEDTQEIGRTRQNERDGTVEAQGLHSSWQKILEAIRCEMQLHGQCEEPDPVVLACLEEPGPGSCSSTLLGGVSRNSVPCKLTFLWRQPPGLQRGVWQQEDSGTRNDDSQDSLNEEQPAPAGQAMLAVQTCENACRDETGEGTGECVAAVENSL
jgi:hypothetical protein